MNAAMRLYALSTSFDRHLGEWGGALLSLAIRLYVGWAFFKSGLTKLDDWSTRACSRLIRRIALRPNGFPTRRATRPRVALLARGATR